MAIGTKSGAVKIYGAPGVEFTGLHKETATVTQMHFLPGQGRLLSLLDDNTLHLWEIYQKDGYSHLEETRSFVLPGRPGSPPSITRVTVISLQSACDAAYLGTEGGGVYVLELPSLTLLEDRTLYQDEVMQRVPEDYRCGKALGPVESLQEHPQDPAKILIGYSRGLMVLWDKSTRDVSHLFLGNQQLESLAWERSGRTIVSSHSDGGYAVWSAASGSTKTQQPATSTIPYGPFPCKAINKIVWQTCESGGHYIIFSGGMPRASYGDRHCVTILQGQTLVTLDFTSRVIDFFTVYNTEVEAEFDNPIALVVLVEEELVAIDLKTPGWPTIPAPYLAPLHSSAITCSYHISNVPLNHEDGTVRFWDASGVSLKPLYKLGTANIFQTDCDHTDSLNQSCEEEWPPFRKVGCFDPYSDDPRLGIQKIALCKYTAKMVVAGTAGQVLMTELSDEKSEHVVNVAVVDLLQDREGFTWKGHDRLPPKNGSLAFGPGFQPSVLVQCMPPAAVTAVTLHSEWNLVAFGTSHGFGLYDYYRRNPVLARCTLHPNDSLAMEGPLSRVKSLKKSLRQSFRRIRKSRVSGKKRVNATSPSSKVQEANAQLAEQPGPHEVEMTPVQPAHHGPTLWAGTNSGSVFAYALEVPSQEKFSERAVEAVLGKEIQLMHRAPVVSIAVLDGRGNPLPEPYEVSRDLAKAPDMQGSHSVLIASEEQFKLTAHEGCRVRKVGLVNFASAACEDYTENGLACLTNLGDIHIFTVPGLRPQVHYDCIRKEDISGIASCVFTKHGQGFYLISPSEFERFSLSTRNITEPLCVLDTSRVHDATSTPKLNQANGTHVLQGSDPNHSLTSIERKGTHFSNQWHRMLKKTICDSCLKFEGNRRKTSSEETERNLRNLSDDEARSPGILIK
ncbi:hypothetical protein JD844_020056 [Phrynosoma platyrhinos]|uniref:Lethal giant larvae homologue 2 domain-containing protein n=1 Tax=Phrynosoma platyrhinos TaxID=52577 RepID=A0ABQ7TRV8_PHRPL|nr:hypothetical protein JD844_020056 [Phrynosoma platyrhinos]